jgi:hypothetical protein
LLNPWRAIAVAATVLACAAIVTTYRVFSQTYDEPAHIASGMEWIDLGTYHYEAQHPPLARIAAAAGPYVIGARSAHKINQFYEGNVILGAGDRYRDVLAAARLGELPFFLGLCLVMWLWARRLVGESGAALAVLFTATNPNLLAHAALATTDMAPATLTIAAMYAYAMWIDAPTRRRTIVFGATLGLAAVSKFSAIAFLGAALLLAELWRALAARRLAPPGALTRRQCARGLCVAFVSAFLVVWAAYRFSVGAPEPGWPPLPAPELFRGVEAFMSHGTLGHPAFLLGETSLTGWWYYFPVALAVKTPVPLLLLGLIGVVEAVRSARARDFESVLPLIGVVAVLGIAMLSAVDIGIRHVLALYPFLSLLAARGALLLWREAARPRVTRAIATITVCISIYITLRAHPDFLSYFNPLAGAHPERILVDSNLDWGQDLYRLAAVDKRLHMDSLRVAYFGSADLAAVGVPNARVLRRNERVTGWVAASQTMLAGVWVDSAYAWLYKYEPVGRVGHSIVLYLVPPPSVTSR